MMHALQQVVFASVEEATKAAETVHNVEWPVGNNSKLKVKYVEREEAVHAIAVGRGEKLPSGAPVAAAAAAEEARGKEGDGKGIAVL